MEKNLKGIISYEIRMKSLNDKYNYSTKLFIESLEGHSEIVMDYVKDIEGADVLFPEPPLYCFVTESNDYLLIKDMKDNTLYIYIVWISEESPFYLIKNSTNEIYKKLKSNKNNGKLDFNKSKYDFSSEIKLNLYPSYNLKKSNKIDTEISYNFLKLIKEKRNFKVGTNLIIRGVIFVIMLTIFILLSTLGNIYEDFKYILLGALIPEFINGILGIVSYFKKDDLFIDISNLRIMEDTNPFTESKEEEDNAIKDPE